MTNATSEPWTVLRLLNWTKDYFSRSGLAEPRICAEVLLAHALGLKRIELYTRFEDQPPATKLDAFRDMVKKAATNFPVAYLVGSKEFYSLNFKVTPDVLIPRPETEALVDLAIDHLRKLGRPGAVWDVCTGSGCVGIAIAANVPDSTVLATDISPAAVGIAAENAAARKVADRTMCLQADLLSVPEQWTGTRQFDVIVSNPPYVADGDEVEPSVANEPHLALRAGADGLDVIRRLAAQAPEFLVDGGILAIEFGSGQADDVRELVLATGQFDEPVIRRDYQKIERILLARRKARPAN